MEQNLNFEYKGFKANGFVMFFLSLAMIAAGVWGIVNAINVNYILTAIIGIIAILVAFVMFFGLMVIEPNQARVLVNIGLLLSEVPLNMPESTIHRQMLIRPKLFYPL